MKKKSFYFKLLIPLIGSVFVSFLVFAEKVQIKKPAVQDKNVIQFKGFGKITAKVDSQVDSTKVHAIRFISDDNKRVIVKVKADIQYDEAVKRALKTAKSHNYKNPKLQNFYTYSYGCQNMQTNQWDTFVNEEDWTSDMASVSKRAEKITEEKRKANPKAYKNASCGGGGGSSTSRDTEENLKEKNLPIYMAENEIKLK